jgi:hypothetical protein
MRDEAFAGQPATEKTLRKFYVSIRRHQANPVSQRPSPPAKVPIDPRALLTHIPRARPKIASP